MWQTPTSGLLDPKNPQRRHGRCEAATPTADWAVARSVLRPRQDNGVQRHDQEACGDQYKGGDAEDPFVLHRVSRGKDYAESGFSLVISSGMSCRHLLSALAEPAMPLPSSRMPWLLRHG